MDREWNDSQPIYASFATAWFEMIIDGRVKEAIAPQGASRGRISG